MGIREVARRTGLSVATVSRTVNGGAEKFEQGAAVLVGMTAVGEPGVSRTSPPLDRQKTTWHQRRLMLKVL